MKTASSKLAASFVCENVMVVDGNDLRVIRHNRYGLGALCILVGGIWRAEAPNSIEAFVPLMVGIVIVAKTWFSYRPAH